MLTAVGLLPIATAGIDIEAMMKGAPDARDAIQQSEPEREPSLSIRGRSQRAVPQRQNDGNSRQLRAGLALRIGVVEAACTARAKARTTRAFTRLPSISPRTCTPWANSSKRATGIMFETVHSSRRSRPSKSRSRADRGRSGRTELPGRHKRWISSTKRRSRERCWRIRTATCRT